MRVTEGVRDIVWEGVSEGVRVTEGVHDIVWDGVSEGVGLTEEVGEPVPDGVPVDVGDAVFVELLLAVAVMVVREVELPVEIAV